VDARPHYSGKTLITGHTSQKSGMPAHFGHTTCLDTCAWCGGWLTALLVEARVLIQVSEEGMVRELELDALPVMPGGGE
jgi:serine/threonine protein phosphatase 1